MKAAILTAAVLAATFALAADQGASTPGALRVTKPGGGTVDMPLRHTKVSIEVSAFVARATIEQVFENPFDAPVEAVYTFPLGDRAAVDDFELQVGDRTIRGEIKRREEARATYEQARAAGYQAALLEQERPNIFTQSVANLEPGKSITVRLRTVETLRYERGVYRLTFPLVVGPRYIPAGPIPDAARIASPALRPGTRSGHDVEIAVAIDAGVPLTKLESPSHKTIVQRSSAPQATVRLADEDTIPNKDFLLRWSVASERPAVGLLAHRSDLDGFFTLLVQPKGEIVPAEAMPKEITFVLDTSGSMSGIPLDASKRFAAKALGALGPRDTFNLIRFAGDNEVYSKDPLPNERQAIASALEWFNRQQGGGGTEMLAALKAAFARPTDPNRVRIVVFLTDGFVGNDEQILGEIGKLIGDARIYTVGIGSSVNHYLHDRMADLGRGAYVFVRPDEAADDALEAFRSWVTLPYLTDLSIDWGALPLADVVPERLRDLGSGQTLTLVGRYLDAGEGNVVIRGRLGGRYWEQTVHVVLPERQTNNEALAAVWARGRIEDLLQSAERPTPDSVRAEVTALGLAYRLMSPFTSFVAVDDSRVVNASGNPRVVRQALPVPDGVSFEGIFGMDGPAALREKDVTGAEPEEIGDDVDEMKKVEDFIGSVAAGVAGGVPGGVLGGVPRRDVQASPDVAQIAKSASPIVPPLPVAGRFYQNVIQLAPAGRSPSGDGNPNVNGARERDFKTMVGGIAGQDEAFRETVEARERLLNTAFRVLADLADDGKLSPAEGRPALAALLAAQRGSGAIAENVAVHAVATWALAEAALSLSQDPWVAQAKTKALDYLVDVAGPNGWPRRPGSAVDFETTRWARLVLASIRPASVASIPVPAGPPAAEYAQLRTALAAARSGGKPPKVSGQSPFDRLVRVIGRGHLRVVKV
jgi:Ca-activated chloride channel family protein